MVKKLLLIFCLFSVLSVVSQKEDSSEKILIRCGEYSTTINLSQELEDDEEVIINIKNVLAVDILTEKIKFSDDEYEDYDDGDDDDIKIIELNSDKCHQLKKNAPYYFLTLVTSKGKVCRKIVHRNRK